ncbi:hypothetical protein ACVR0S_09660 [Streptococcus dentapri]|uniref:DUF3278 domain-containing protein n=1 Tax=Streptococcus dentapri TaxID=573564 RepID=A0ABV8D363_9STRE
MNKDKKEASSKQIVFDALTKDNQAYLLDLGVQRQKSHWESIGFGLVVVLSITLMIVMETNHVSSVYSNKYMMFSTPILFAYLGFRIAPKARLFSQADKTYPGWRQAVKGRVHLKTGDQLVAFMITVILAGFVFAVFSSYYRPNTKMDPEKQYKQYQPSHDIPKGSQQLNE